MPDLTSPDPYLWVDKMEPEPKRLLLEALRSDRFHQGKGALAQPNQPRGYMEHCCLGVMCEVAIEAGVDVTRTVRSDSGWLAYDQHTLLPPSTVKEWAFGKANVSLRVPVTNEDTGEVELFDLPYLNDDLNWSFAEIADAIEKGL